MLALSLGADMRRREFISLLGGAVASWPLAARAQQPDKVRVIGVLTPFGESDPETRSWVAAFEERLQSLGWAQDHRIRIESRWVAVWT